jgi:hypothetical protein
MLIGIIVMLSSGSNMASELGVEFCATVAKQKITLGTHSRIIYFLWNRTSKSIEYYIPPIPVPVHYFDVAIDHLPPTFSLLNPGEFILRATPVPIGGGFSADIVGKYNIPVSIQIRDGPEIETLEQVVRYELVDEPPPDRYVVKKKRQRSKQPSNEVTTVFVLDDSQYREERKRARSSIMAGRSQDDIENYLEGKRQWYDTSYGHLGFGEPEDWTHERGPKPEFALLRSLDSLMDGAYTLSDFEYRKIYEVEYQARVKYGLSPYYAVKHAIYIFREKGRGAALEYLHGLESEGWNCVEDGILRYTIDRIGSWALNRRPEGLVYTKEMLSNLGRGQDGRLFPIDQLPSAKKPKANGTCPNGNLKVPGTKVLML